MCEFHCVIMNIAGGVELPYINCFTGERKLYNSEVSSPVLGYIQSVLVSGAHLRPATNFSFSSKFLLDSCWFIIL
jgi:hypothetical protein